MCTAFYLSSPTTIRLLSIQYLAFSLFLFFFISAFLFIKIISQETHAQCSSYLSYETSCVAVNSPWQQAVQQLFPLASLYFGCLPYCCMCSWWDTKIFRHVYISCQKKCTQSFKQSSYPQLNFIIWMEMMQKHEQEGWGISTL